MMAGIIVTIIGVLFLLKELGYIALVSWDLIWPVIIILVGVSMMMRRCRTCGRMGAWHCGGDCGNMQK